MNALVPFGSGGLVPASMDEALRLAEFMSRARTVPKHLQDSPGDCLMCIEQAMRWQMSPFAVAQATSVISGKMMFEGKLVAAAVETSGAIVGHLDYSYTGEGDTRAITVSATRRGETTPRTVTVTFKEARTGNEMWKRQPDQQLVYHGARVWARRWAPAVILGVYSREEMGNPTFDGPTIDAEVDAPSPAPDERDRLNASVPLRAAAADMPRGDRVVDKSSNQQNQNYGADRQQPHPLDEANPRQWLLNLETMLATAQTQEEVVDIAGHATVGNATARAPRDVKQRVTELLAGAYARFAEEPEGGELPEVEIVGEEKVGAG